jgi:hypothetical protein
MTYRYKPTEPQDDVDKVRSDIAHDVAVGKNAKVSLGGMRQASVKVLAIGKDGIWGGDKKGRRYRFFWKHVIGPTTEATDDLHNTEKEPDTMSKTEPLTKAITEANVALHLVKWGKPLCKAIKAGGTRLLVRVPKTTAPVPTQATAHRPTAPAQIGGTVQNAIDLARLQLNHLQAGQK